MTIYFIQEADNPSGPIKIGFTDRRPEERLQDIQNYSPVRLAILKVIEGNTAQEAALHRRFSLLRLHGEWFTPDQSLLDFINDPKLEPSAQGPDGFYRGVKTYLRAKLTEAGRDVSAEWVRDAILKRYGVKLKFSTIYSVVQGNKFRDINRDHLEYICTVLGYTIEEALTPLPAT